MRSHTYFCFTFHNGKSYIIKELHKYDPQSYVQVEFAGTCNAMSKNLVKQCNGKFDSLKAVFMDIPKGRTITEQRFVFIENLLNCRIVTENKHSDDNDVIELDSNVHMVVISNRPISYVIGHLSPDRFLTWTFTKAKNWTQEGYNRGDVYDNFLEKMLDDNDYLGDKLPFL